MPRRYLKPGIRTSERWDSLSWMSQSFYIRLITLVDDYGRYEAHPVLLRSDAFPLREDIRASQVTTLCKELADSQLAIFYKADGKFYLQLTNWTETPRSDSSKCPAFDETCMQMWDGCTQMCSSSSSSSSSKPVAKVFSKEDLVIPDSLNQSNFISIWNDWVTYRMKLGGCKDWKDLFQRQLSECEKWGLQASTSSITKSLMNHYKGLFEPKGVIPQSKPVAVLRPEIR